MLDFIENEITRAIHDRRSIRKYRAEPLSQTQLHTLLSCGFNAPNGSNSQTWFISVVQLPEIFRDLTSRQRDFALSNPDLPAEFRRRFSDPGFSAVFGATTALWFFCPKDDSPVNVSLMSENIVLAAHSIGLGTCYLGGIVHMLTSGENDDLLTKIGRPDGFNLVFGLAVGYPEETPDAKPRDYSKVLYIR